MCNFSLLLLLASISGGCVEVPTHTPTAKEQQAAKAEAVAESIKFDENAEIDNIKRRLDLTSNPGLLGYIVLFNDAGQPIEYTTVKGKVTSGSKRLTSPEELKRLNSGDGTYSYEIVQVPSDEGTYGSSNPYIYFWDQNGAYHQWNGTYLYEDRPIRLSIEPLVISGGAELVK